MLVGLDTRNSNECGEKKWWTFAHQSFHFGRPGAFSYIRPMWAVAGTAWSVVIMPQKSNECPGGVCLVQVQTWDQGATSLSFHQGTLVISCIPALPPWSYSCRSSPLLGTLDWASVNLYPTGWESRGPRAHPTSIPYCQEICLTWCSVQLPVVVWEIE